MLKKLQQMKSDGDGGLGGEDMPEAPDSDDEALPDLQPKDTDTAAKADDASK